MFYFAGKIPMGGNIHIWAILCTSLDVRYSTSLRLVLGSLALGVQISQC